MVEKLFFWLVDIAIVNSFIFPNAGKKERRGRLQTNLAFHKNLISQLTGNMRSRHAWKNVRPSSSDTEERGNGKTDLSCRRKRSQQKTAWFGTTGKWREMGNQFSLRKMPKKTWFTSWIVLQKYHTLKNYN